MRHSGSDQKGKAKDQSLAGGVSLLVRFANLLPFLILVLFLGGWSLGFYRLQADPMSIVSDDLRCLVFFGGLLLAALLGAWLGTFLKRLVWKQFLLRTHGDRDQLS